MREKKTAQEIEIMLQKLSDWVLLGGRPALARRLIFADFKSAFAFMREVADEAERIDHHPEWTNVWNRVDIVLTTHSAKGLTELDEELATFINGSAQRFGAKPNQ